MKSSDINIAKVSIFQVVLDSLLPFSKRDKILYSLPVIPHRIYYPHQSAALGHH